MWRYTEIAVNAECKQIACVSTMRSYEMKLVRRLMSSFVGFLDRLDRTLQDLVYKLVPGLLSRECRLPVSVFGSYVR